MKTGQKVNKTNYDVAIIGGGAVGLSTAYYLTQAGYRVTVLDENAAGKSSEGNAGMIVPSHVIPLAAPGVITRGLRWLLNPESPFFIKPRLNLPLFSWLWRFRSSCTHEHVHRSIPILLELSQASVGLFQELEKNESFGSFGYRNSGLLMIYNSEEGKKDILEEAVLAESAGVTTERFDQESLHRLEPGLRGEYKGGVLYIDDGRIDPNQYMALLESWLEKHGVVFQRGIRVDRLQRTGDLVTGIHSSGGYIEADTYVLAAGAWSEGLARSIGARCPVQPGKGFSITVSTEKVNLKYPYILTDERLTVTPMPGRLRFAGTLALAGFDGSIDRRRTAPLRRLVKTYFPEWNETAASTTWFGYRPCSPDGLPIIGRLKGASNVIAATGHGMMGVTLAPVTGKLVTEMMTGSTPVLAPEPFSPDRFH